MGRLVIFLISDYYHPTYTGKDIGLLAQLATPNNKLTSDKYLEALRATGKLSKIVEQSPVISVRFLWPRADRFELDYFLFDRHRNHLTLNEDHFTLEALGQMEHDAYEKDLSLARLMRDFDSAVSSHHPSWCNPTFSKKSGNSNRSIDSRP